MADNVTVNLCEMKMVNVGNYKSKSLGVNIGKIIRNKCFQSSAIIEYKIDEIFYVNITIFSEAIIAYICNDKINPNHLKIFEIGNFNNTDEEIRTRVHNLSKYLIQCRDNFGINIQNVQKFVKNNKDIIQYTGRINSLVNENTLISDIIKAN